jgi:hypothetical protein
MSRTPSASQSRPRDSATSHRIVERTVRPRVLLLLLLSGLIMATLPTRAQDEDPGTEKQKRHVAEEWSVVVSPYAWLSGVRGTAVSSDKEVDVDIAFSDILDVTEAGFMLYTEARWRKLFFGFDATWAELALESEGQIVDVAVGVDQAIYDVRIGYQVANPLFGREVPEGELNPARTDLFIGARYFSTVPTLSIGLPGQEISFTDKDSRWDPFVGIRTGRAISRSWGFGFRGDIGGFGLGSAAEFTWQASFLFEYQTSKLVSFSGGYRLLAYDTVTGTGEERNGSDFLQHGPLIGAAFKF